MAPGGRVATRHARLRGRLAALQRGTDFIGSVSRARPAEHTGAGTPLLGRRGLHGGAPARWAETNLPAPRNGRGRPSEPALDGEVRELKKALAAGRIRQQHETRDRD